MSISNPVNDAAHMNLLLQNGTCLLNTDLYIRDIDAKICQLSNRSATSLIGQPVDELIGKTGKEALTLAKNELMNSGNDEVIFSFQLQRKDTKSALYQINATLKYTFNHILILQITNVTDALSSPSDESITRLRQSLITAQNKAAVELSLRQQIMQTTGAIVTIVDNSFCFVDVNQATLDITGYTKDQLIGHSVNLVLPERYQAEITKRVGLDRHSDHQSEGENPWITSDGSERWFAWRNSVIVNSMTGKKQLISIGVDITERRQFEEEQRLLLSQYKKTIDEMVFERNFRQRTIESSNAIIVVIDADGIIVEFNPAAEDISGYTSTDVVGRSISILLTEDMAKEIPTWYNKVKKLGMRYNDVFAWITKDGQTRQILWNTSTFDDNSDDRQYIITTGIDVTEMQQARQNLTDANNALTRLNQHLEDRVTERTNELQGALKELEAFSYSVSHDLRSPLRHIVGFIELIAMKKFEVGPDLQRYLDIIKEAAGRMSQLIEGLLEFAKMGREPMRTTSVPLADVVRRVMSELQPEYTNRIIEWQIQPLPTVSGDPDLLFLVFQNLISNAIKFTKTKNPAIIEIYATQDKDTTTMHIKDNGVGFDMQYADKLFGVFQRLHRPEEFEGTGIGLANVRRIIERHGGKVWASAALNQGADFAFTLPMP